MIQYFADWLVYEVFGLRAGTTWGTALNFFFYDTIKILILLFCISVLMGIVNSCFPIERLRNYLLTHRMYGLQYLLASLSLAPSHRFAPARPYPCSLALSREAFLWRLRFRFSSPLLWSTR